MEGILALNPGAFAGGDPSRLQAGADLLLPDASRSSPAQPDAPVVAETPVSAPAVTSAELPVSAPLAAVEPAPEQTESLQQVLERQRQVDLELPTRRQKTCNCSRGWHSCKRSFSNCRNNWRRRMRNWLSLLSSELPQPPLQHR